MKRDLLSQSAVSPTRSRAAVLDILRGVALFGILIVNMEYYSQTIAEGWAQPQFYGTADLIVAWLSIALFQFKAFFLFALLFGYGIGMQIQKAQSADAIGLRRAHRRRMFALSVIGLLHGVLLFSGDILVTYALLGALSTMFWRMSISALIKSSCIALVVGVVLAVVIVMLSAEGGGNVGAAETIRDTYATGTFAEIVGRRITDLMAVFPFVLLVQGPMAFAFLLSGIAMAKAGVLTSPNAHRPLLRRLLRWGLSIGLIGGAVSASLTVGNDSNGLAAAIAFLLQLLTGPAWCLGVVGLVTMIWAEMAPGWLGIFRSMGRMSLTVYIEQSLLCGFIFMAYGLGWFGQVGPAQGLMISIFVIVILGLLSRLWLKQFYFGPLEWLLRSATYGQWQVLRREEGSRPRNDYTNRQI